MRQATRSFLARAGAFPALLLSTLGFMPVQAATPGLPPLTLRGEFRLRATSYHGALSPSAPGTLPDLLQEAQRREIARGADGIGVQQTARLELTLYPASEVAIRLGLRGTGWWGVDRYTSGTYGAPVFLSDPLQVEELYATFPVASGQLYLGRQMLRFGPLGLLVATPSHPDLEPSPLAAALWEGSFWAVLAGRAAVLAEPAADPGTGGGNADHGHGNGNGLGGSGGGEASGQEGGSETSGQRLVAHDIVALRVTKPLERAFARQVIGLNLLLLGPDGEQGLSLDMSSERDDGSAWAAELALARRSGSPRWVGAAVGHWQWPLPAAPAPVTRPELEHEPGPGQVPAALPRLRLELTLGAINAEYAPALAELRSSGGRLPLAPGDAGGELRLRHLFRQATTDLAWGYRGSLAAAAPPRQSLAAGITWEAAPSLRLRTAYEHWWESPGDYGRWVLEVSYGF